MAAVYRSITGSRSEAKPKTSSTADAEHRQRVLLLSSRGVTYRHRHLLNDLYALLPHSRKDAKLDTKTKLHQLNELADLYNCNNVFFFEARKGKDLYLWMSKPPNGPTIKFHMQNLHTMEELHFTGNCLKGSRPILSFDQTFDSEPHLMLIKEVLLHIFGVPKSSRKTKPFVDHVMGFTVADGRIWIRCYQVNETEGKDGEEQNGGASEIPTNTASKFKGSSAQSANGKESTVNLIEIGPRFVMTPIVILEGSFGGPVIYENKEFVSPNQIRAELRSARASKRKLRDHSIHDKKFRRGELGLNTQGGKRRAKDPLDDRSVFA